MVARGGGAQRRGLAAFDILHEAVDVGLGGNVQRRGHAAVGAMADGYVFHASTCENDGLKLVFRLLDAVVHLERALERLGWRCAFCVGAFRLLCCACRIGQHVAFRGGHDVRSRFAQKRDVLHDDLTADAKLLGQRAAGKRRAGFAQQPQKRLAAGLRFRHAIALPLRLGARGIYVP